VLLSESTTRGFGPVSGQVPANAGKRYRAEVLTRADDATTLTLSVAQQAGQEPVDGRALSPPPVCGDLLQGIEHLI
jgi:hypothetical protein